jgi:hypothetical protein
MCGAFIKPFKKGKYYSSGLLDPEDEGTAFSRKVDN